MAQLYKYKAMDERGKMRTDRLEAENLLDLEQRLRGMGLDLVNYRKVRLSLFGGRKKISRQELINFSFQMEQLTRSGVSILEALSDLRESSDTERLRDILSNIIDQIEGGKTLSEALNEYPEVFDTVYVALVKVGEESGRLSDVLHDLAETLKWHDELVSHTKKIMIYPSIVTLVVIGVVSFLMIVLVPQLIPFLKSMGGEIPFYTRALIGTSNVMAGYWYLIFGVPVLLWLAMKQWARRNDDIRYRLDNMKLKIWLFGPLILKSNLARFASYFAMMYAAGLTVLDSLKISEKLVDNTVLRKAIIDARNLIQDGDMISASFKSVAIYPPLVIRMLKVGENTGAMDDALLNISYFYNRDVKETIDKLEASITPVLTVILGLIMLWIIASVLMPIYDTMSKLEII